MDNYIWVLYSIEIFGYDEPDIVRIDKAFITEKDADEALKLAESGKETSPYFYYIEKVKIESGPDFPGNEGWN